MNCLPVFCPAGLTKMLVYNLTLESRMLKFRDHRLESELEKIPTPFGCFFQIGTIHFEIRDHKELRILILEVAFRTKIALKLIKPK